LPVLIYLKMQMIPGRIARGSHIGNDLAFLDFLPVGDCDLGAMGIERCISVIMLNLDIITVLMRSFA